MYFAGKHSLGKCSLYYYISSKVSFSVTGYYFFRCQKSTFNLENNKCTCQRNFFGYHVPRSTYSIFRAMYLKDIYRTLNFQYVSELTSSLNL